MKNFLAMIVSYVVAAAIVLSYVFVALGSIVGIIFCVETLIDMYRSFSARYNKSKKSRAAGFESVRSRVEENKAATS